MTRRIISLNDYDWRLASVAQKPFDDVNDFDEARDWLPARVPGDVRLDLLRAGRIADPFYATNNEDSHWVDSRDWWYETNVALELQENERAFLVFDGIDYESAVFLDGEQLGRHVGMFSRQIYQLPSTLSLAPRPASLAIRIWGSDALPRLEKTLWRRIWGRVIKPMFTPPSEPYPDRYATLKCQMQFGWDFAPRLRTCGIWDDVYIVVAKSVFIRDAFVKSQITDDKLSTAHVQVAFVLDSDRDQDVRMLCGVHGKNFASVTQTYSFDLALGRGIQTREIAFDLPDARLWNPWDRGEPNLYEIEMHVESADGMQLDSLAETFGIRSLELVRAPDAPTDGEPWTFIVNGRREFLRGANWVPLDAILARVKDSDYAGRLKQARDAKVNFLRVWGGGLKEKRAFYDQCDEMGILVWQEFPFAGAIMDRFPRDRAFLDFVREECSAIVRTLRNHPALVVWCGGNEFNTRGNSAIVETLRQVVAREDGTRPFKPASPYRDESHNWAVWHRYANMRDYRKDQTPFMSEFGLQSPPNLESLKQFLPDDALAAPNALWEYHHAELKKLERYAGPVLATRKAVKNLGDTHNALSGAESNNHVTIEALVDASQRAQAFGLQVAIEHMRRGKGRTAGVAVWQLNDAWPAISWSVIDYYGVPKRAYDALKKLYTPVFASFEYPLQPRQQGDTVQGELWLINDLLSSFQNAEVSAYLNGTEIFKRRVNIAPDSATRIDALDVTLGEGENILRLKVNWGPAPLSDHEYDLNYCDVGEVNVAGALLVAFGKRLMR